MPFSLSFDQDALLLDIDGTLLDIAPSARQVRMPHDLAENLYRLSQKLDGAFALISGRTIEDIDRLFAPYAFACAGVHGAEYRLSSQSPVIQTAPLPETLLTHAAQACGTIPGVLLENKTYALAFHYRQNPSAQERVQMLAAHLAETESNDLRLLLGRKVVEIVSPHCDKGMALRRLMQAPPFQKRRPVFLGDDTTDLAAMGACLSLGGQAARVGKGGDKTFTFKDPAAVRAWIADLLTRQ